MLGLARVLIKTLKNLAYVKKARIKIRQNEQLGKWVENVIGLLAYA